MTPWLRIRRWLPVLFVGGTLLGVAAQTLRGQAAQPAISAPATGTSAPDAQPAASPIVQSLLDKARALEARGRMDMAAQTWEQVLLTDPNNPSALGGLARAAKLNGNTALSNQYLDQLRAVAPDDPNIAKVESMGAEQDRNRQLQQAGTLAEGGQYAAAMQIYRQVFGANPPPGEWALAYYETESATEDGRPHAIAGLRALIAKSPTDSRYQIALGRILTYDPKTREEGRRYLQRYPRDAQAVQALRQSLLWDAADPTRTPQIRAYLATHPDAELAAALNGAATATVTAPAQPPSAAVLSARARNAAEAAAYRALNAKHLQEAETRFKAILVREPENPRALAGMGYIRMQQGNFSGAISFLEQARHNNAQDKAIDAALDTSRFWFLMGEGDASLNENDLTGAERQYRSALALRPASAEALQGLGGTLLKAQQPAAAQPLFEKVVALKPTAPEGWRGLVQAQLQSGNAPLALATDKAIPPSVHVELMKDPAFLRALASAYSAVGRDADAQPILQAALRLPYFDEAKGPKADTQIQYAGVLLAANRLDQAAALYRQVLAEDHANTAAWQGLVRVEHAMAHDPEALETVESMPPANYATAMRDPGFEQTVASLYQAQKKLDVAQDLLEKAVAQQTTTGQQPPVGMQLQLAGIYLERGNALAAEPLYRKALTTDPQNAAAWAGLLAALHTAGRDKDAVAQVQQVPSAVRASMEDSIGFLQTMASVYTCLGQPREASLFLERIAHLYALQHSAPPAEIDIQQAWLAYNGLDDRALYDRLMNLGGRADLTDDQRRTVQTIWTDWAVRRANQAAAAGNLQRSLAILNAAARSFPDNPAVLKALANGFARAGQPAEAVAIYQAQNMASASTADYQAAIGAALAAGDRKDAETWLRFALKAYPTDPQVLVLAAKFEQSRGDTARAIDYYRQSLKAMPPADPGAQLAADLSLPAPSTPPSLPSVSRSQDLPALLAPGAGEQGSGGQPYLPSYRPAAPQPAYGETQVAPSGVPISLVPPYMSNPARPQSPSEPGSQPRILRRAVNLPSQAEVEWTVRQAVALALADAPSNSTAVLRAAAELPAPAAAPAISTPQTYQQAEIARLTHEAAAQPLDLLASAPERRQTAVAKPRAALPADPVAAPVSAMTIPPVTALSNPPVDPTRYHPAPVAAAPIQLADNRPRVSPPPRDVTDIVASTKYLPNARAANPMSSHPDIASAQAAEARRHQSDVTPRTGHSLAPSDDILAATADEASYSGSPASQAAGQNGAGSLVRQPATPPTTPGSSASESGDQQYPQPHRATSSGTAQPAVPRRTVSRAGTRTSAAPPAAEPPAAATPAEAVQQPVTIAPGAPSGLAYPPAGSERPPTDADLMARNLPPLRGGLSAQVPLPSTPRQDAEDQLAALEGSYSGWVGGTGIGRYRSGTPGLDRLYDIEAPVEASAVIARAVRLSIVARPVFLNSGVLDSSAFGIYAPNTVPYLGTLPANAANPPAQQLSNGIGGELQLTTRNLGLAAGYTPYEFLVQNITGRFRWRPVGGPVTFFATREPVRDTQLSYAGLRDPGTVSPVYAGTIWGGVVSTTGGARLDLGSNGSGFYLSGDGGVLRGDHVLSNTKFEGSMGAYFRVKSWPQYGSLTVGGSLFGMHYAHNELGLTYGQGGYFSPNDYFLAGVPISFNGFYGANLHYSIAGSIGVQTFQQDTATFYPLDPALQTNVQTALGCTLAQLSAHSCGQYPTLGNTGFNYSIDSEVAYRFGERWYLGAFLSGNNTNNYNTVSGGFFFRYTFRKQRSADGYPSGLFPTEGLRPLQIP